MKKFAIITLSSLVMLTLFTLLLRYLPGIKTKPDIILIIVIYIAIASDRTSDIFTAFILGCFYDIFSGNAVGLFAMLRTVTLVTARYLNMNFFSKNLLFFVVITFVISIFDSIYLGYQFSTGAGGLFYTIKDAIYISFVNGLAALFVYPVFTRIDDMMSFLKISEHEGRI